MIKKHIRKWMFRLFIYLGDKLYERRMVWINGFEIKNQKCNPAFLQGKVEVITFTNIKNWQRKTKRSKRYFGISTPKNPKPCLQA